MTEKEFLNKVDLLGGDIFNLIRSKAKELLKSGSIDLNDYEDDYILPKIFIKAMGGIIQREYHLMNNKGYEKTARNIEKII